LRLRLGGGPLPAGPYEVHFRLEAEASAPAQLTLADETVDVAPGTPTTLDAEVSHPGGPLTLSGAATGAIWIGEAKIATAR